MSEVAPPGSHASDHPLVDRIAALIEQTRSLVAVQANVALTLMNWEIGHLIDVEVLEQERADYAQQIVASPGPQLAGRFGRGFDTSNLHRMIKVSQVFPDRTIVAALGRHLSWTHFKALLPVPIDEARAYYIEQAVDGHLSVRGLRDLIGRQGYERREIANAQHIGLAEYEHDVLYPLASQQISIDLDASVKANYPRFGAALQSVPGLESRDE